MNFSLRLQIVVLVKIYTSVQSRLSLTFRVVTQHQAGKIKDFIVQKKFDFCIKTFVLVPHDTMKTSPLFNNTGNLLNQPPPPPDNFCKLHTSDDSWDVLRFKIEAESYVKFNLAQRRC